MELYETGPIVFISFQKDKLVMVVVCVRAQKEAIIKILSEFVVHHLAFEFML